MAFFAVFAVENSLTRYFRFGEFSKITGHGSSTAQPAVAFTKAQRGIERLAKSGIVTEITQSRRDRVYCAKKLLAILEEPASLVPRPV